MHKHNTSQHNACCIALLLSAFGFKPVFKVCDCFVPDIDRHERMKRIREEETIQVSLSPD
jgi:hypothetical protein